LSRSLLGRSRRSAPLRGRWCAAPVTGRAPSSPASRDRARPVPVAPWLAMSDALDAAKRLPVLAAIAARQIPVPTSAYGLCHRTCGASSAPSPPALPPAQSALTVHTHSPASQGHEPRHQRCHGSCAYPPAVSCSLRTSSVLPTLITESGTEHATASGSGTPQSGVFIYSNDVRLLSSIARLTSDGGSPNIGGASAPGQSRL
jgi:hypothetical protein